MRKHLEPGATPAVRSFLDFDGVHVHAGAVSHLRHLPLKERERGERERERESIEVLL
jgi:hypothetical protein